MAESPKSIIQMIYTPMEVVKRFFGSGGKEFGDQEKKLEKLENLAHAQHERMARGEPCGGDRRDSGRGDSSSDLSDSVSSGSGSISSKFTKMQLEQPTSIDDSVFEAEDRNEGPQREKMPSGKKNNTRPSHKRRKGEED